MYRYNQFISVTHELQIFVSGKLFSNQSDDYTAYNPETGEEITWREIRKLAQEYFDAQESIKPDPQPPNHEISKPKDITELLKSGAVQIGNNSKLQERLNKIQKPEPDKAVLTDKEEPKPIKEVVTHKPEGNTQTVTHKEEKKNKVTHSLKSKAKIGELNPKFNGYYGHGKLKYSSASQLAKLHEKPTKTIIQWCKKCKNGYFYEPIQK